MPVGNLVASGPKAVGKHNVSLAGDPNFEVLRSGVLPRRVHFSSQNNNDPLDPKNLRKAISELCDLLQLQEYQDSKEMCIKILSQILPKVSDKQVLQNLYTVLRSRDLKKKSLDLVAFKNSAKILFKYFIDFLQDCDASVLLYTVKLERLFEDANDKNSLFEKVSTNVTVFENVLQYWASQEKDLEYVIRFLKIACEFAAKGEKCELAASIAEEAISDIKIEDLFRHIEFIQVLKNLFAQGSSFSSVKRLLLGQILKEERLFENYDDEKKKDHKDFQQIKVPYIFFQAQLTQICQEKRACFEMPATINKDSEDYFLFLTWCDQISQIWSLEKLGALDTEFLDQNLLESNSKGVQTEPIQSQKDEQKNNAVSNSIHNTKKIIKRLEGEIESLKKQVSSTVQKAPDVLEQQNKKFQKNIDKLKKEHQTELIKLRSKCESAESNLKVLELQLKHERSRHQQECQSLLKVLGLEIFNLEISDQLCSSSSKAKEVAQAHSIKYAQPQELAVSVQLLFLEKVKAEKEALEKELRVTRTEKAALEAAQTCQQEIFGASLRLLEDENAALKKDLANLKFGDPNRRLKDLGLAPEQIRRVREKALRRHYLSKLAEEYPGKSIEEILDLEQKGV